MAMEATRSIDFGALSHPLEHPDIWTCPITGMPVPKRELKNLEYRRLLLTRCEGNRKAQETQLALCRQSFLYWVNTFGWTYVQYESREITNTSARRPMVTWPVQDTLAEALEKSASTQTRLVVDKARDMGASWCVILWHLYLVLFRKDLQLLWGSLVEDKIDKVGDSDSLFWKLDFANSLLPEWMQGDIVRTHLLFLNKITKSAIKGETCGEDFGRSGRAYQAFIDEGAGIRSLGASMQSCGDTTKSIVVVSTPKGPGAYSDMRFSGLPVVVMGYWDHPHKGQGRELKHHPYFDRVIWCTPALDIEIYEHNRSRKDLAQNWLIDHETSGSMVFDSSVISFQQATYATKRPRIGRIEYAGPKNLSAHDAAKLARIDLYRFVDDPRGKLRLWCELKNGRPDQTQPWAFGIDVSTGVASSNSVIAVGNANLKTKCADYRSGTDSPDQLAEIAAVLGYWFGGPTGRAFIGFEANGPGQRFGQSLLKVMAYPWIDKHRPEGKTLGAKPTKGLGWTSNEQAKETILQELRADMASGQFVNHSPEALHQAGRYVYYETGGIGPAALEHESADAWATHGDDVIADAILNRAMKRMPRVRPEEFKAPRGSAAWAFKMHEDRERQEDE